MAELADEVQSGGEVINDAPIPEAPVDIGIEAPEREAKPEKQSIRQAI